MSKAVAMQAWAIVKCQSRSVMAGGPAGPAGPGRAGAELDRRRRSVIKSQVHRQIYEYKYIYIPKTEICISRIASVHAYSIAGNYAHCMQRITGSRPVCTFLEPWYVLVCSGMYWYVPVCTCTYISVLECTGMYLSYWKFWYEPVCSGTYWYN
jgi:hypothetical protein